MAVPEEVGQRLAATEAQASAARDEARAAWLLAASHDRDLADLGVKVDANRRAINALGVQTAARFDRLEAETRSGFAEVNAGFAEMRGRFDQMAAGMAHIADLITPLLPEQTDEG